MPISCKQYLSSCLHINALTFGISALCVPVNYTVCAELGFSHTSLPNPFWHQTEDEAITAFKEAAKYVFNELCQEDALRYLCSLYFPKCDPKCDPMTNYLCYPCRSLCNGNYCLIRLIIFKNLRNRVKTFEYGKCVANEKKSDLTGWNWQ